MNGDVNDVSDRSAPLDALRGLAVLAVLGVHLEPGGAGGPRTQAVLALWEAHGWVGVDLFFVLSGFLIGSLLIREQEQTGAVRVGRFLIRRGFKIYPLYYTMLLWTMLPLWVMGNAVPLPTVFSEALFVQNYGPSLYPVTWSLAIEEHFYLLFAGAIWLARGRKWTERVLPVVVGLGLAVLAVRALTVLVVPPEQWPMHATHVRLDALLWGVAIAAAVIRSPERTHSFVRSWRWALAAAAVALPAGVLALPPYHPWATPWASPPWPGEPARSCCSPCTRRSGPGATGGFNPSPAWAGRRTRSTSGRCRCAAGEEASRPR